jgi:hypothetical protein
MKSTVTRAIRLASLAMVLPAMAGPYSRGWNDPLNAHDAPVSVFTGPHGEGKARIDDGFGIENPVNHVNPLFFAWADAWEDYERSDADASYSDPTWALGAVTGDNFDVVSLGEMTATQIANGDRRGGSRWLSPSRSATARAPIS